VLRLAYLVVAGIAVGLVTAWIVNWIERRVTMSNRKCYRHPVRYAAYFDGGCLTCLGSSAWSACGLYLTRRSSEFFLPGVRLRQGRFGMIDLRVSMALVSCSSPAIYPYVLGEIQGYGFGHGGFCMAPLSAWSLALRVIWVFPGAFVSQLIVAASFTRVLRHPRRGGSWSWAGRHAWGDRLAAASHCRRHWPMAARSSNAV